MLPLIPLALGLLPDLVRAVAGANAGRVAQAAVGVIAEVTGTTDPAEARRRIDANPEMAASLRIRLAEIAAADAQSVRDAELAEQRQILADVQSARAQTVALAQAGSGVQWAPVVVSAIVLLSFAAMGWAVLHRVVPPENKDAALLMLGHLSGFAGAAVAYWLGSSAGSARKDATLRGMAAASKGNG